VKRGSVRVLACVGLGVLVRGVWIGGGEGVGRGGEGREGRYDGVGDCCSIDVSGCHRTI
jgi:hypothetical protein